MRTSRKLIARFVGLFVLMAATLAFAQAPKPPQTVTLPAPPGAVKFEHAEHMKRGKCTDCHHASKPEKPMKGQFENCSDCHTKTATPPMKTKLQAAFHNPTATAGTCIDCHKKADAAGKKAPTKCGECHKKA